MGGDTTSEVFLYYKEQTIRAFLIAREYFPLFFEHAKLSEMAGLKCFFKDSVFNFEKRFLLEMNDLKCAGKIDKITMNALNNHRTIIYDKIQYIQNKIAH